MPKEAKVIERLKDTKKTLACAESCTGGLLAHKLTNISGSSGAFKMGFITYFNEAKIDLLRVPASLIKRHGAVSEEVATVMAQKARKLAKTDFGVGISGIAGPTGGTKTKPVGLVFIAVASNLESICLKCQFKGSRTSIKTQTVNQALNLLLEFI